jgi:hypothetical protein
MIPAASAEKDSVDDFDLRILPRGMAFPPRPARMICFGGMMKLLQKLAADHCRSVWLFLGEMISLSANAVAQLDYKLDDLNVRDTFRFSLPELLENFMTEAISVTCRLLVQKLRFPLQWKSSS